MRPIHANTWRSHKDFLSVQDQFPLACWASLESKANCSILDRQPELRASVVVA
jgi:hypothetical protein